MRSHFLIVATLVALLPGLVLQGCGKRSVQGEGPAPRAATATAPSEAGHDKRAIQGMVLINAGSFVMGADDNKPHEGPTHRVTLNSFWIDTHEVTVSQFAGFVKATGYRTEAEDFGWSGVFDMKSGAWRKADGADWRHPDGPASQAGTNEPVCQVSWKDAMTYSTWAGKRLPTEAEWEYAARGGLIRKTFAWGDELRPGGKPVANWWQGVFPEHDTGEDGFVGRSPIGRFPPNGYGLYDMTGNVWEWCADWYDDSYYARSPSLNPEGPAAGKERSMRGGSWMCSENFCSNYRPAGRGSATPDTGLNNLGFRCARDAESSSAPAADGTRP